MKVSFQRLFGLMLVLCICLGILLSGCTPSGDASDGTDSSAPKDAEQTVGSESEKENAPESAAQRRKIELSADTPVQENWTEQSSYKMDFDGDGEKERVSLFVDAQRDGEGKLARGDGQNWVLSVEQDGQFYTLFDERVQNGNVYFEVSDYYTETNSVPTVTLIRSAGAGFRLIRYTYDKAAAVFEEEILYDSSDDSTDGINLRYSSIPEAE